MVKARLRSWVILGVGLPALMSLVGCVEVASETLSPITAEYLEDPEQMCAARSDRIAEQTLALYLGGISDEDEDRLRSIEAAADRAGDRYMTVAYGPDSIARANAFVASNVAGAAAWPFWNAKELERKMPDLDEENDQLVKEIRRMRDARYWLCTIAMGDTLPRVLARPLGS